MRHDYWPNGLLKLRTAVKTLERETDADDPQDTSRRDYRYFYNRNRSLVRVVDEDANRTTPGDQARTTVYERDDAEREQYVDEQWGRGRDVEVGYETGTGRVEFRRTDGELTGPSYISYTGDNQKTTTFTYDSLGRELEMVVDPEGEDDRTTTTRWHDSGAMDRRVKPNGTVDEWDWDALGQKTRHERTRDGQSSGHVDTYAYDEDGNRELDERGRHQFNARDQLVSWQRSATRGREDRRSWITDYTRDGNGKATHKAERPNTPEGDPPADPEVTHVLTHNGDRLTRAEVTDETQASDVVTTQTFVYDDAGNAQRVRTVTDVVGDGVVPEQPSGDTALDAEECTGEDTTAPQVTRYCYDEFNRQVFSSGFGVEEPAVVTYDGLDRRDSKVTEGENGATERRDYSYIGTSELLTTESIRTTDAADVATTERHSYDYDSRGERQGQQVEADATVRYRPYAKDANGSVVGLEDEETGEVAANKRYDYDPYGELDREVTPASTCDGLEAGLSQDARDNPFRFEGFYYDSGVKTYDMHARHYRPELGQFLGRDQYASASGDQALQSDPLTQNRYAFAGGNPVSNVEFDGHVTPVRDSGGVGGPRNKDGSPDHDNNPGTSGRVQRQSSEIQQKVAEQTLRGLSPMPFAPTNVSNPEAKALAPPKPSLLSHSTSTTSSPNASTRARAARSRRRAMTTRSRRPPRPLARPPGACSVEPRPS